MLYLIGVFGYQVVGVMFFDGNVCDIVIDDMRFLVLGNVNFVLLIVVEVGVDMIIVVSCFEGELEFVKQLSWQFEGMVVEFVLLS